MTEGEIKREICEFLDKYPSRILFTISPPRRGNYISKFMRNGWPDIYGLKLMSSAIPFFIEVKKPGGTLSIEQHQILGKAKAWGAIACVATCVDDVREALGL